MFQLYHKYMYDLLIGSRVKNKNKLELVFVKHYAPDTVRLIHWLDLFTREQELPVN